MKPAEGDGDLFVPEFIRVRDNAARVIRSAGKFRDGQTAENDADGCDAERDDALGYISSREVEDVVAFEENTGADHNADDHGNCGEQAIFPLFHVEESFQGLMGCEAISILH